MHDLPQPSPIAPRAYRAARHDEALALVKRDLGAGAVIVGTREVPASALLGRPAQVEILALPAEVDRDVAREADRAALPTLERRLLRAGLAAGSARALAARVRAHAGREPVGEGELRRSLAAVLADEIVFAPPASGGARVVAFVGPTGVGKTTTVAKVAARAALMEGRSVLLVSMDRYRVGGVEQLARYAELIGVPVTCAWDGGMLAQALRSHRQAELVLVDTEGRGPRDLAAVEQLARALGAAREPVEVQLCVAAATREPELERVIGRAGCLGPTRLCVTKVDEAVDGGGVVAAYAASGLPLCWLTTGQRVPEDLEVASAEGLAALLCGSEGWQ
jgi:flagellar biosynthesis protein FlhF